MRLARIGFSGVPHIENAISLNQTNNITSESVFKLVSQQRFAKTGRTYLDFFYIPSFGNKLTVKLFY